MKRSRLRYRSDSPARQLALAGDAVFSLGEHAEMDAVHPDQQWKCSGASGRAKKPSLNSVAARLANRQRRQHLSVITVSQPCQLENLSLAICTPTPFTLTATVCNGSIQLTDPPTRLPIYCPEQVISMTNT